MTKLFGMTRRAVLAGAGAGLAAGLARPALAQQAKNTLRFIPQADLAILDPLTTTAYPTRGHAHLVWDTLYGIDDKFVPQPQLAEGHTVSADGLTWTFTLRDGPKFHDGEKILAKDAVASVKRWMLRDAQGQSLAARLDALTALDDRKFQFRLKRPFGSLVDALGKSSSYPCFIFPERFATQDPSKPLTELVGSGPYRYIAADRVPGSRVAYQRFDGYVPTPVGAPSMIAGPKLANFERIEWHVIPDSATQAAAMQSGEADWLEMVPNDLEAVLKRAKNVTMTVVDPGGLYVALRFNQLLPPFNDPAARRALLPLLSQSDFMQACTDTREEWKDGIGFFPANSPYASDAGMAALTGKRDAAAAKAAKAAMTAAGKVGAPVAALHATDSAMQNALMSVAVDMMGKAGLKVDDLNMDFATLVNRRMSKAAVPAGGWNVLTAIFGATDIMTPGTNFMMRGNGANAWFGWPDSPKLEELHDAWLDATDQAKQLELGRQMQVQAFQDLPYIPCGQVLSATAYRAGMTGIRQGMVLPLNAKWS